jgi:hypothetical protein
MRYETFPVDTSETFGHCKSMEKNQYPNFFQKKFKKTVFRASQTFAFCLFTFAF